MNKNNTALSVFTIVAVFALGVVVYSPQNAGASSIADPQQAILEAQDSLNALNFPGANNETREGVAEGQEGLANLSSMLNSLGSGTGDTSSPLGQSGSSPLGQSGSSPLGQSGSSPLGQSGSSPLGQSGSSPLGQSGNSIQE